MIKAGGGRWTLEKLSEGWLGFVHRHLSILVAYADKGPVSYQVLE